MLATATVYPAPLMLVVAVLHLTLLQLQARREEAYLTTVHGQSYVDYSRRVGRFFPNILARVTKGNKR
jgi:protein-S-isoprenylcysteine O-methyltransferase Ste14